mgnify:CR=1 FL=1
MIKQYFRRVGDSVTAATFNTLFDDAYDQIEGGLDDRHVSDDAGIPLGCLDISDDFAAPTIWMDGTADWTFRYENALFVSLEFAAIEQFTNTALVVKRLRGNSSIELSQAFVVTNVGPNGAPQQFTLSTAVDVKPGDILRFTSTGGHLGVVRPVLRRAR